MKEIAEVGATLTGTYLVLTFTATGLTKAPSEMVLALRRQHLVPRFLTAPLARALGPYEVLLGAWIASGLAPAWAGAFTTGTLLAFLAYRFGLYRSGVLTGCACSPDSHAAVGGPELLASAIMVTIATAYTLLSMFHHIAFWPVPVVAAAVLIPLAYRRRLLLKRLEERFLTPEPSAG